MDSRKYVWKQRNAIWIEKNLDKPYMYKVFLGEKDAIEKPQIKKQGINYLHKLTENGSGIYTIICEKSNSVYIGQSLNMESRLRNHKMCITRDYIKVATSYYKMRQDRMDFGINSFKFSIHKECVGIPVHELLDIEKSVMMEFILKGFNLYNKSINLLDESIVCPKYLKTKINSLIQNIIKDESLIVKLDALLDSVFTRNCFKSIGL